MTEVNDNNQQPVDPNNSGNNGSDDTAAQIEALKKQLANVQAQNKGLIEQQKANSASNSAASSSANEPTPSSASNSGANSNNASFAEFQSAFAELKKQNDSLVAEKQSAASRASYSRKAEKDSISLNAQDLDQITGSKDPDGTYKYIKALKAQSSQRKYAPRQMTFKPSKENIGAELASGQQEVTGIGGLLKAKQHN